MKKIVFTLVLALLSGGAMAQKDKAAEAALKAAKKEAKANVADAQKIYDELKAKLEAGDDQKKVEESEVLAKCKQAQELVQKALASNLIEEKKLGEAYKLSNEAAIYPHNIMLEKASSKQPFDTAYFYSNLKILTSSLQNELKYTKVTTGEYGNEKSLNQKRTLLSNCGDYYIYAGQFESGAKRYDSAIEAYEKAINYKNDYPEVAEMAKLRIEPAQIAYYAFHTAYDAKNYDVMEKFYEQALKFEDGAVGTKQVYCQSFLDRGDTLKWSQTMRTQCLENPEKNADAIQILLSYYQRKGLDQMEQFADEVIAKDENLLIAIFGKAFVLFKGEKYDEALKYYVRCTEIKPDYFDAWYQAGTCKFRQAYDLNQTVSSIKDQKAAKAALEQVKVLFGEALPYFEKARECEPNSPDRWAYELKQCYTVVGESAKAAEMDKLIKD